MFYRDLYPIGAFFILTIINKVVYLLLVYLLYIKYTYMKGEFTKYELEVLIGIFGYTKEQVYYFRKASKDTEKFIANIIKIRNERRNINS